MRVSRLKKNAKLKNIAVLIPMREGDGDVLPENIELGNLNSILKDIRSRKDFTGKKGSLLRVPIYDNESVNNLYLIGLGKAENVNSNLVRDTLAWGLRTVGRQHNKKVLLLTGHLKYTGLNKIFGEISELSSYEFDKYKTKSEDYEPFSLEEIILLSSVEADIEHGKVYAKSQIYSRELANEPGCEITPAKLAEIAKKLADEKNLTCEIWDEKKLKSENMGGILAVGSGSENPPRLIHLIYKPRKARKKIIFVGKGITFDSGGLNIKPDNYMLTMKGDKTGACNVLGIMRGVSELKPDIEVHGILSCAENMPSGSAYKPDDIIRIRNGKTVEINNTDAEGRLVLADALSLASELKPDVIIDMATLTGACAVALGKWCAGLFVKDDELAEKILNASEISGEKFWRMPHEDDHISESLKSNFADLTNSGQRYGGAIFATLFLSNFVDPKIKYAHMDIAGTDFYEKEYGIYSKGASAFGVRTCLEYVMNL